MDQTKTFGCVLTLGIYSLYTVMISKKNLSNSVLFCDPWKAMVTIQELLAWLRACKF